MIGIYVIQNCQNNKVYIGQSWHLEERLQEHKRNLNQNKHDNQHLQSAWNMYGEANFKFDVIWDLSWLSELEKTHAQHILDDAEVLWLDYYGGANSNNTYNIREGGWGGKYSEEYCQHLSETRKGKFSGKNNSMFGRHHTEASKEKISQNRKGLTCGKDNGMFGKHHSKETKQKISNSTKGRVHTEAEKQKRAASMQLLRQDKEYQQKVEIVNQNKRKYTDEIVQQLRDEYEKVGVIKIVAQNHNMNYEMCRQIISRDGRFKE